MKKILLIQIPFLLLLLYGGCSNGGGSNNSRCSMQEMKDRFANTACISEELVNGCSNIICRSTNETDISIGNFDENCMVVDCETLECDQIVVHSDGVNLIMGSLTNIVINEMNGLPPVHL